MKTIESLKGKYIRLEPFAIPDDYAYLLQLTQDYPYSIFSVERTAEMLEKFGKYYWIVYIGIAKVGVAYLSYFPDKDMWAFTAFEDRKVVRKLKYKMVKAAEVAKLVCVFANGITDMIYSMHDRRHWKCGKVLQYAGFKFCDEIPSNENVYKLYIKRMP